MIHSPGSMPTGNFDEPVVSSPPTTEPARTLRLPAAYYSAPLSEVKPIFPAWVPWGCGSAAALFLVLMFAGSAALTGPRLASFLDFVLGISVGEMKGMYESDITEAQQEAFDAELKRMREQLRDGKITVQKVQPFLQAMQKAVGDEKVTSQELEGLTKIARESATPPAVNR